MNSASDPAQFPGPILAPQHMVFDCLYGPPKTARSTGITSQKGARSANEISMLQLKGRSSFSIWFIASRRQAIAKVLR